MGGSFCGGSKFVPFLMLFLLVASCSEQANPNKNLKLSDYDSLRVGSYVVSPSKVHVEMEHLMSADKWTCQADGYVRRYYRNKGPFIWINRIGVAPRADSLLAYLPKVCLMGFSPGSFRMGAIASDLRRVKNLDFDNHNNQASKVFARLEYNLTRAYLRYVAGQRFGFVSPRAIFNHLEAKDGDSSRTTYKTLFDIRAERPGDKFWQTALRKVRQDSVAEFMAEVEPRNPLYRQLLHLLHSPLAHKYGRHLILVNLERSRWRLPDDPYLHDRYVLVNIPSFHLVANDGDESLSMRMGCGSTKTKTPLIVSKITRMDVNPQWIVPRSIVKSSIARHAGSSSWFASHRYFVRERNTGKVVDASGVTPAMLFGGGYLVVQEGGEGNSLGRIIFRFNNGQSIFLHGTPNPRVFQRTVRDVSHGCVRLERPLALAGFLLGKGRSDMLDKVVYSARADVSPLGKDPRALTERQKEVLDTLDRKRLVGRVKVEPDVPVFILYYTLFPNSKGGWDAYRDVYGYDVPILDRIRSFM